MQTHELIIPQQGRLDKMLSLKLHQSRNQIEKLIREGLVEVAGKVITKPSYRLSAGDTVHCTFREAKKQKRIDFDFDIDVLYEDEDLLVINKPSGLVVHPAPSVKEATLVDWLIHRGVSLSTISGEERHGIVHRIDKETTGALVVAKNNKTHQALSAQLQDKSMGRYYLALIDVPLKQNIKVEKPIFRNPHNRLKMAIVDGGRESKTEFVRIAEGINGTALIAAKLYTGRTHQIRVHLESLGRHILGDELYGYKGKKGKVHRVYLHAYLLYLVHPSTSERVEIAAPIFSDMRAYMEKNFNKGEIDAKIQEDRFFNCFMDTEHTA
ncbi:MAG: RluA family pseudouridine synthase [Sulfurovum sp.]|nr:RluA family pseudouridine synthase [Sulfurovum sp.]